MSGSTSRWTRLNDLPVVRWIGLGALARLLYYSGLLWLVGQVRQRVGQRRLIVLMYHRVRPDDEARRQAVFPVEHGITPERFAQQLRVLRWFGKPLTLSAAYRHLRDANARPRCAIAVTFDDGYRDNLTFAEPMLARHRVPATIFPVVRCAESGERLWWDELAQHEREGKKTENEAATPVAKGHDLSAGATELHNRLLSASLREREDILEQVRCAGVPGAKRSDAPAPQPPSSWPPRSPASTPDQGLARLSTSTLRDDSGMAADPLYLSWAELQELRDRGWEMGGHTRDHPSLTRETPEEAWQQIVEGRQALEDRLGSEAASFAYPHGAYNAAVRQFVGRAGFRLAVTTEHGINTPASDPLCLRRVPVTEERPFELAFKLAFYDWVHRER